MKKILFLFLFFICTNSFAENIKVAILADVDSALSVKDGRFLGVFAKKYQCVFDQLPYSFDFQELPYARLLKSVEKGMFDIGLPLIESDIRNKIAIFTLPIATISIKIYSQKAITDTVMLNQLSAVFARSSAVKIFAEKYDMTSFEVTNWEQAVKMVKYGRHDVVLIPAIIASSFESQLLAGLSSAVIGNVPVAMYISKKLEHKGKLVKEINAAIKICLTPITSPLVMNN